MKGKQTASAYLAGGVVEHLLPRGVQPVLVSHDTLLCHKHHLPRGVVHAHGPLVPQCSLLCLLLGLGEEGCQDQIPLRGPLCQPGAIGRKDDIGFISQTTLKINAKEATFYREFF